MAEVEQSTQLDFDEAMEDFATMFPDMDADVIEAVLRSNQGAVHATIDQLLSMTTDTQQEKSSSRRSRAAGTSQPTGTPLEALLGGMGATNNELPPSYALSATPPPSYQQAVPSQSPMRGPRVETKLEGSSPLRLIHGWSPQMLLPLPHDFLKLPSIQQSVGVISPHHLSQRLNDNSLARIAVGESDAELVQYLRDERIALFLQNDEFMTELRTNRDFMHTLQSELEEEARCNGNIDSNKRGEESSESVSETTTSTLKHNTLGHIDDDTLKARIATMGKVSRKKFAQIARVFSRSKRSSSARTLLQGGAGGSTNGKDQLIDDTLVEEDEEREIRQSNSEERSSPKNVN